MDSVENIGFSDNEDPSVKFFIIILKFQAIKIIWTQIIFISL